MSTKVLMTVEQFAQLQTSDTEDYELVEGEVIPFSTRTPRHNKTRDLIGHLLWSYFKSNPIGESFGENDCRTADDTVRRPDVSVFLNDRLKQIDMDKIPAPFAPDIAVEVLSPSESAVNVRRRVREYLRAGGKEVWLLDHKNAEILVHTSTGIQVMHGSDILVSPLLPGFSTAVAELVVNL